MVFILEYCTWLVRKILFLDHIHKYNDLLVKDLVLV